jgi:hypothetical protein
VLGTTRQIEVYRQPEAGRYREVRVLALDDSIECACVPGIQLKVAGLFTSEDRTRSGNETATGLHEGGDVLPGQIEGVRSRP